LIAALRDVTVYDGDDLNLPGDIESRDNCAKLPKDNGFRLGLCQPDR
jgi:hypothetical protein